MFIREISLNPGLEIDSNQHPLSLENIRSLKEKGLQINSGIIFFVGENGSGKTTLLEALASSMGAGKYGGSKNFIQKEEPPILEKHLIIAKKALPQDVFFFRAETFFNLQKELEEYVFKGDNLYSKYTGSARTFREFSHGQGFKLFFENRVRKNGLYFFDEPESALSPQSQIELLFLLKEFELLGCQLFIATHSPILLAYPKAQIFSFDSTPIKEITYEETPAFSATKGFLDNYKRYQKELI